MPLDIPFSLKLLFYGLTVVCFTMLMSFMKNGIIKAKIDREKGAAFQGRVMLIFIAWFLFLAIMSLSGFFMNWDTIPPRITLAPVGGIFIVLWLFFSKTFQKIIVHQGKGKVLLFQTFRMPLEIFLWLLFLRQTIPEQMTQSGFNFDIVPSALGIFLLYFHRKGKLNNKVFLAWNVLGIATVLIIVFISAVSKPSPIRLFSEEPANTFIAYFPYVWLPGFLVPFAILFHLVGIKQAIARKDH